MTNEPKKAEGVMPIIKPTYGYREDIELYAMLPDCVPMDLLDNAQCLNNHSNQSLQD